MVHTLFQTGKENSWFLNLMEGGAFLGPRIRPQIGNGMARKTRPREDYEPGYTAPKCFGRHDYVLVCAGGRHWASPDHCRRASHGACLAPSRIALADSWPSERVTPLPGWPGANLATICRLLLRVLGYLFCWDWRIQVSLYPVHQALHQFRSWNRRF